MTEIESLRSNGALMARAEHTCYRLGPPATHDAGLLAQPVGRLRVLCHPGRLLEPISFREGPNAGGVTMKTSTERILTTHVGSIPRPESIRTLLRARLDGQAVAESELAARTAEAVTEVVHRQAEVG